MLTQRTTGLRAAQNVGYVGVVIGYAGGGLDHKEDEVGLVDGYLHLGADGRLEDVVGVGGVAAGVHYRKFTPAPVAAAIMAVAGNAGDIVDDCLPHSNEAIEEG